MRGLFTRIAIAGALAVVLPAGYASAQCTNLANGSADPVCKAAEQCQDAILKAAQGYSKDIMGSAEKLIKSSQLGTLGSFPKNVCVGGTNSGLPCVNNTGVCKKNPVGAACTSDSQCGGSAGSCDLTKGCGGGECSPSASLNAGSKDSLKARAKLEGAIQKKCVDTAVAAADLGLANIPGCDISGSGSSAQQFKELADCLEQSVGGDLESGKVVDTVLTQAARATGTGGTATRPQGKPGLIDEDPRLVLAYQGSNLLQIGNGAAADSPTISGGGSMTYVSLASCTGGNGNKACMVNKDCGTDSGGAAGTCNDNCSGSTCLGTGLGTFGNTLTVTSACTGGLATCLHTKTKNAGNGTPAAVTVDLATGLFESHAPIGTDVYLDGVGVNCSSFNACPTCEAGLCTGSCVNAGLASTATPPGGCTSNAQCAVGSHCTAGGGGTTEACTAPDGQTTPECLPQTNPGHNKIGTVPNPFDLGTGLKTLTPIPSTGTNIFCGHCDNNATPGCQGGTTMCAQGCQSAADCVAVGGTLCDTGAATEAPGASWDNGAFTIESQGAESQNAPVIAGSFCTGVTGVGLVDGTAGLPGPVRFIAQEVHAYGFTKDKP